MFVVDAKDIREEVLAVKSVFHPELYPAECKLIDGFVTQILQKSFWVPEHEDANKACVDRLLQVRGEKGATDGAS